MLRATACKQAVPRLLSGFSLLASQQCHTITYAILLSSPRAPLHALEPVAGVTHVPAGPPARFQCGKQDLNLHGIAATRPSTWRVCQFRHSRYEPIPKVPSPSGRGLG